MKRFFITGLPRSRTAWLANLFTTNEGVCYHEKIRTCATVDDLVTKLANVDASHVGDSSCAHYLYWGRLAKAFPDAKWVVIERDMQESFNATRKAFPQFVVSANVFHDAEKELDLLKSKLNPMVVPYREINNRVYDIGSYIGVDLVMDRVDTLVQMKVEIALPEAMLVGHPHWTPRLRNDQEVFSAEYIEMLRQMCGQNVAAFAWLVEVLELAMTWDHFTDGDPVDGVMADRVFSACLMNWPNNPFFVQYGAVLVPVIHCAILDWKSGTEDGAYTVYTSLPLAVALILGGRPLAEKWSLPLREVVAKIKTQDNLNDKL